MQSKFNASHTNHGKIYEIQVVHIAQKFDVSFIV